MSDIASGIKKDTAEKLESIIVEYGKISKTLLKESGVHEVLFICYFIIFNFIYYILFVLLFHTPHKVLMTTARNFAANETSISNTSDVCNYFIIFYIL